MEAEITLETVAGYIAAVDSALEAAGHKVEQRPINRDTFEAILVLPDALSDDEPVGLALLWEDGHGWDAAVWDPAKSRVHLNTDLALGVVPAPEVIVRAVAAIAEDGLLRAGRVVPGTAELLARYAGGKAPEAEPLDLIAATSRDDGFGYCIGCGSLEVAHRALYISTSLRTTATRVAWCSAGECQEDRARSAVQSVPVKAGPGGFYGVANAW